jgi:DNA-binding CsgD family transcriptional regulator
MAGATDFLEKPFDDLQLQAVASRALAASEQTHDEAIATARIAERVARLTPREREVLDRVVTGQQNKTIAYDLGASPRTIEVLCLECGPNGRAHLNRHFIKSMAPPHTCGRLSARADSASMRGQPCSSPASHRRTAFARLRSMAARSAIFARTAAK